MAILERPDVNSFVLRSNLLPETLVKGTLTMLPPLWMTPFSAWLDRAATCFKGRHFVNVSGVRAVKRALKIATEQLPFPFH